MCDSFMSCFIQDLQLKFMIISSLNNITKIISRIQNEKTRFRNQQTLGMQVHQTKKRSELHVLASIAGSPPTALSLERMQRITQAGMP